MSKALIRTVVMTASLLSAGWLLADDGDADKRSALPVLHHTKWQAECASCHTLYHPGLLPESSWRRLMGGLDRHFGENASLDSASVREITDFLVANSADHSTARRSQRINQSIPAGQAPLRITETGYFMHKHDELSPAVFRRAKIGSAANCMACHAGAEKGDFAENRVRIPR